MRSLLLGGIYTLLAPFHPGWMTDEKRVSR